MRSRVLMMASSSLPAGRCRSSSGSVRHAPKWRPADFMLKGTAARLLFGNPALVPFDGFAAAPFTTSVQEKGDELRVTATLANRALKSSFTDTYWNDLNPRAPFNDRALVVIDLPPDWVAISKVEAVAVKAGQTTLPHRLVGHAVETDQGKRRLHVQVDVAATGFQQSAFRVAAGPWSSWCSGGDDHPPKSELLSGSARDRSLANRSLKRSQIGRTSITTLVMR